MSAITIIDSHLALADIQQVRQAMRPDDYYARQATDAGAMALGGLVASTVLGQIFLATFAAPAAARRPESDAATSAGGSHQVIPLPGGLGTAPLAPGDLVTHQGWPGRVVAAFDDDAVVHLDQAVWPVSISLRHLRRA